MTTTSHETLLIVEAPTQQDESQNTSGTNEIGKNESSAPFTATRLDLFLTSHFVENGKPLYSRTYFQKLIEEGLVKLNGELVKKRELVALGDEVEIAFPLEKELHLEPEDIPLDVLYEDEDLLIVNKPSGMVIHPAPGNPKGTFANALLHYLKRTPTEDPLRPGIVHRLDKDTTGALIAAKNPLAHRRLVEMFSKRQIKKEYLAVCLDNIPSQTINLPIGRDPRNRKKMWIDTERAKSAKTIIETLQFNEPFCLVRCELITGRTHQIRVHLAGLGHPIIGDPLYGSSQMNVKYGENVQLLHAHTVEFMHPITNIPIKITAPLPLPLKNFLKNHFDL